MASETLLIENLPSNLPIIEKYDKKYITAVKLDLLINDPNDKTENIILIKNLINPYINYYDNIYYHINKIFIINYNLKNIKKDIVRGLKCLYSTNILELNIIFPFNFDKNWKFNILTDEWPGKNIFDNYYSLNKDETFEDELIEEGYHMGYHIGKLKTLVDTISCKPSILPYQLFLGNPKTFDFNISEDDIFNTYNLVKEKNYQIYVHLPYIFNLATRNSKNVKLIQKYLIQSKKCGFLGCVIHVPKYTTLDTISAYNNTKLNLLEILYVENACPLLLETPAGQGTEMFTKIDDFLDFVKSIDGLKICVDTAHVFSTKYLPDFYISYILDNSTDLLKLIHFNDSKVCLGSCRDLHERLGEGYIPKENIRNVAKLSKINNIHLIREY